MLNSVLCLLALAATGESAFELAAPGTVIKGFVPPRSLAPLIDAVSSSVVRVATTDASGRNIGSGFVLTKSGLISTNAHVLRSNNVTVSFKSGVSCSADVIGKDEYSDIALLRTKGCPALMKPIPVTAPGREVRTGDFALVMGSPLGLQTSASLAMVSGIYRNFNTQFEEYIQLSVQLNSGNSGGPVVDMAGAVLGMASSKAKDASGIGFAIPAETLREVLPRLLSRGQVKRGHAGLTVVQTGSAPARVVAVTDGGPAQTAGLRVGDVVLACGKFRSPSFHDVAEAIQWTMPGEALHFEVARQGRTLGIDVLVAEKVMPKLHAE